MASKHGLYVHLPFCETKCGYCDFYSVPLMDRPTSDLVSAAIVELKSRLNKGGSIRTVFVGGGTPTVLPIEDFRRFFKALGEGLQGHCLEEFTVEANPATVDAEKMGFMVDSGTDRVSMGAQSWHAGELATLERLHTAADIEPGVSIARAAGIRRINLDLIFGIPGQTEASWGESLRQTIDLGVDHISCYGLTYEPGTRMTAAKNAGRLMSCDEDFELGLYRQAIATLAEHGYEQYEISNFARKGQQSQHNLIYWRQEPYIGVGPSAAGYVEGLRYKNVADIGTYVRWMGERGEAMLDGERVTGADRAGEFLLMGLRLVEGVDLDRVSRSCGLDVLGVLAERIDRMADLGFVRLEGSNLSVTAAGREVADGVISELYSALDGRCEQTVSLPVLQVPRSGD